MRKFFTSIVALAVIATGSVSLGTVTAQADPHWRGHGGHYVGHGGPRHYRGHWPRYYRGGHRNSGAALGAGIAGFALGAIVGGALSAPRYYDQPNVYYRPVAPRRVYRVAPGRSSHARHVARCEAKYRSYDARTDTFLGYDGYRHYCRY